VFRGGFLTGVVKNRPSLFDQKMAKNGRSVFCQKVAKKGRSVFCHDDRYFWRGGFVTYHLPSSLRIMWMGWSVTFSSPFGNLRS
jgi:hypothetical protein